MYAVCVNNDRVYAAVMFIIVGLGQCKQNDKIG